MRFAPVISAKSILGICGLPVITGGLFAMTLLLTSAANSQQVFRWVDKDGKVHYGDMLPPPAEAKNVQTKKLGDSVIEQDDVPFAVELAMKNNPVTLYANNCGELCANARALLAKRGIRYADKNPESDPVAGAALKQMAGGLQVPTIMIGAVSIAGFDESGWNSALSNAGYPRNNPNLRQSSTKAGPKVAPTATPAAPAK
ncbi:MAG: glutaredoxin family protein [Betaproteobacteria bacterium]